MWYMACKNPENPELRDVYAIVWAVDYMGGEPTATRGYPMNGTVYMITSLRPDIYEKEAKQSGDNVIQDLYSKLVPGLAPSFRPTPEQMKLIMQKAPAIRDIMVDIEKAYAPLDREQSLHRLDMAFEQIAKKNKELDQQWQDLVKSLKDLKTPSEETKRTIDVLYNVILTFCTQQNKIFTEMYKRRGSLPISGQNAQKYINELTEKYMKEMDKFLKYTK